jgi:cell wall-associated NlpC family hydrolase
VPSPPALLTPPAPPESERPDVASLVTTALSFRGVPYRAGGEDPQLGFDCSGYVQYVFGLFHVDLPRTVAEQFRIGTKESLNKIRAGDLLFFSTVAPGATHVAIALGNAKFVHAPSSTGTVRVEALASSYWSARFVGARRVVAAK